MFNITVNVNGASEKRAVPQCWGDVSWSDYVKAAEADKDDAQVTGTLSALTGISVETIEAMCPEHQRFLVTQCGFFWNTEPPVITIPETYSDISISQASWQQLIDSELEFKRVSELELPQIAAAQMVIRTYTKHPSIKDSGVDIKQMKVPEALGYWYFFFSNSLNGRNNGRTYTMIYQMIMRSQQASRSLRRSDSSQHSTHSAKEVHSNMTLCSEQKRISSIPPYCLKRRSANMPKGCVTIRNLRIITNSKSS